MIHGGGILIGGVGSASIITTLLIITIIIDFFAIFKKRFYFVMLPLVIAMKSLCLNKQLLITALLVSLFFIIGGCSPKVLVPPDLPPEQRAHIRGTFGGSIFAG